MHDRRNFLRSILAATAALFGVRPAAAPVAAPVAAVPPPAPAVNPWTVEVYGRSRMRDAWAGRTPAVLPGGAQVRVKFRGRLFCTLDGPSSTTSISRYWYWTDALRRLQCQDAPYTPTWVSYLRHTDPAVHELLCLVAGLAAQQKHVAAWPLDDRVALQGDPIGDILVRLARA
jgi:hypothetical protein